jgi:two-component system alkaline phosphatase synthesis response regulator PhoP
MQAIIPLDFLPKSRYILKKQDNIEMESKKILIADDNENIRTALTYLLEDEGYQLMLAKDGADTIRKVRELHPDILFLDVMMPEINGYDVCRTIKSDPDLKKTYVIMLTAKGQIAEQERGKEVGADEYIVKPFSPMEILAKVKNLP